MPLSAGHSPPVQHSNGDIAEGPFLKSEAEKPLSLARPEAHHRPKGPAKSKWLSTPPFHARLPLEAWNPRRCHAEDLSLPQAGVRPVCGERAAKCSPSASGPPTRTSPLKSLRNATPPSPIGGPFPALISRARPTDGLPAMTLPQSQASVADGSGSPSSSSAGKRLRDSSQTGVKDAKRWAADSFGTEMFYTDATPLPPPLYFLPKDIDPDELLEFRQSYQHFRAGQAAGAKGEIGWLAPDDSEDRGGSAGCFRSDDSEQSLEADFTEDAAYYSEPEREVNHELSPGSAALTAHGSAPHLATSPALRPSLAPFPSPLTTPGCDSPVVSSVCPEKEVARQSLSSTSGAESSTVASKVPISRAVAAATKTGQCPKLSFLDWIADEIGSRPNEAQLQKVPRSHLLEVLKAPWRVEKILGFGFLFCLDILLHELSFTPAQVLFAMPGMLRGQQLSITAQCDVLRFALLLTNVWLISICFDVSAVYHYIRGESFLKLYVIFNMLEMFERWLRSIGVELFDLVMASVRDPWSSVLPKIAATLLYCLLHSTMHLLRVLLLNVAINTSSSAVFLIIVTNNFGEIKSTVFKKYEAKSLFPIITSDIVERFYLVLDLVFVLLQLGISAQRGMYSSANIAKCLALIVVLEFLTDWVKFGLIIKFSEMKAATLENYKEVLMADILLCRAKRLPGTGASAKKSCAFDSAEAPGAALRGIHSFSHVPARRVGFCGVPLTTLVLIHFGMLLNTPCSAYAAYPRVSAILLLLCAFVLILLAKVLLGLILFGCAARRRKLIADAGGMDLFPKIKAL